MATAETGQRDVAGAGGVADDSPRAGVGGGAPRRVLAMADFAVRTNLRMWRTRYGLIGGAAVMLLGAILSLHRGEGWRFDSELGSLGFMVALIFLVRSGLEEQREAGLDRFLAINLSSEFEHAAAMVASLVASWIILCIWAGAIVTAASGDPGLGLWIAASWGLRTLLILGFVIWVEAYADLRLPALLPGFVYFGLVIALSLTVGEEQLYRIIHLTDRAYPASLLPLLARGVAGLGVSAGAFLAVAWLRGRRRR